MTTRSDDAPMVANPSTEWRRAIHATVAISRMRREHQSEFQKQNGPQSERDDTISHAGQNEETNQAAQKAFERLESTNQAAKKVLDRLKDTNPEVEVLKLLRDELVKQLDAYGLVLVLLAGISFVAILQPPGSFNDNGKLQESLLVSLFMLLSTLSFFIACTGLGAVMVGCAQLFRPFFYPKLLPYTDVSESEWLPEEEDSLITETQRRCFRKWLHGWWDVGLHSAAFDDIQLLAALCLENIYRVRRTRIYLGVALVLCIAAYICGALAVMVTNDRQRYLLIGAMGAGGVIPIYEICITMKPMTISFKGSNQPKFIGEIGNVTHRYGEGHPDSDLETNC